MTARGRKLVGGIAIVVFLIAYAMAAVTLADRVPDVQALKLLFFVTAGTLWGAPLIPLIGWMNRGH